MKTHRYNRLLPQNIAPKGAEEISVFDSSDNKAAAIPLGGLTPPNGTKLYSFGLLSDLHLSGNSYSNPSNPATVGLLTNDGYGYLPNGTKFRRAMESLASKGVDFCCHTGDMTNIGFYYDRGDTEIFLPQFKEYKDVWSMFPNMPLYGVCGNHESYNKSITENLTELEEYTGHGLEFTITQGNDKFIFIGQPYGNRPMSDVALQGLYETLEDNRNKRCFVFVHPHISSGNPLGVYDTNPIFDWWGTTKTGVFKSILNHYKNTFLFHGHTHFGFGCQELDSNSTYSTLDGFRSFHVPSCSTPRSVVDGVMHSEKYDSEGYIVDVYDDFVVFNGWDFINSKPIPLGTYKINTPLQTIPAGTFVDGTGTIQT